jgi:hypothetical protein
MDELFRVEAHFLILDKWMEMSTIMTDQSFINDQECQ